MKYTFLFLTFLITTISFAQVPLFQDLKFRSVGPDRGGRVTAVAGVDSQPGTFYMGATGGGVWKSTDYGVSWNNVSDGFFASPSIGAIRVAESNPNIVYVGTGSDGIRSNVIAGKGVYKSSDGGKKWTFLGLEKTNHIGAVLIHPTNPDLAYIAAIGNAYAPNPERGVFRTKDGGKSWEKVLFISDTIGVADLEFAPDDPNTIYATAWHVERKPWTIISGGQRAGGIYKSTDGGNSWKKLEKGLPQGLIGKTDLAVAKSNPNRLWAIVEAPEGEGGVYRSDDRGESFTLVNTKKELLDRPFYYCNIDANPLNADVIYVSSTSLWKSTDGGKNWRTLRPPHGDTHDMWINPNDSLIIIESNDGGANVTTNGGRTWSTQFNQPTAELYQVEVDDQFPYWLYAGQQDNYTTIAVPSLPPRTMQAGANAYIMDTGGCETGPAVPKPGNPNIVYANCKGNFSVYNKLTGQEMNYYVGASNLYGHHPKDLKFRFQRVAPVHVSPHNPDVVYHGSQYLHKTTDDGKTWEIISPDLTANTDETQVISGFPITRDVTGEEYYSTIYEINESKIQEGLIWVGANDGPIHVTQNGGKSWENVTPKDLPPGGRVDCIDPSTHKAGKAYAAILRYQLNDWQPYLYKTEDYGKSWTRITNGIPIDYPVRTVREDPDREGLLYAGTEYGLFISFDDGKNWQPFQLNLPVTPVTDIKVYRNDLVLSTMGRGFWILDNLTPLHQLNINQNTNALVVPDEAYRLRYRGNSPNEVPHFPQPGVMIDYYLVNNAQNDIKLDILDAGGKVIRSFGNNKNEGDSAGEREMETNFFRGGSGGMNLDKKAGLHRVRWDMRHEGAWDAERPGAGGPMAAPGMYQVQLTVDGQQLTDKFFLRMDPRLKEDTNVSLEDLRAQEELTLKIRDLLSDARRVSDAVKKRKTKLEEMIKSSKKAKEVEKAKQELMQIDKIYYTLEMEEGRYMMPKLIDQIEYLNSMLNQADQRPGKDAYEQYDNLVKQLDAVKKEWQKFDVKA